MSRVRNLESPVSMEGRIKFLKINKHIIPSFGCWAVLKVKLCQLPTIWFFLNSVK